MIVQLAPYGAALALWSPRIRLNVGYLAAWMPSSPAWFGYEGWELEEGAVSFPEVRI